MSDLDFSIKVLVVDDMPTMRRILKNVLKEIGYTDIEEAENGEEGLKKLRERGFGLVVSDWNMPVISGVEMLRAIRADTELKHLPVLLVAAETQKENMIEAVQAGVEHYAVKPFTAEALQEKLMKVFETPVHT